MSLPFTVQHQYLAFPFQHETSLVGDETSLKRCRDIMEDQRETKEGSWSMWNLVRPTTPAGLPLSRPFTLGPWPTLAHYRRLCKYM